MLDDIGVIFWDYNCWLCCIAVAWLLLCDDVCWQCWQGVQGQDLMWHSQWCHCCCIKHLLTTVECVLIFVDMCCYAWWKWDYSLVILLLTQLHCCCWIFSVHLTVTIRCIGIPVTCCYSWYSTVLITIQNLGAFGGWPYNGSQHKLLQVISQVTNLSHLCKLLPQISASSQ